MAQTTPPSMTPAPSPAPQRNDRATFSGRVDAFVTWLAAAISEFSALATNVYNNAVDAYNSATSAATQAGNALTQANNAAASATSAAATANAAAWNAGTAYALNVCAISQVDFRTYRRKVAGTTATDPANDSTNWTPVVPAAVGLGGAAITGNTTLTVASPGAMTITPTGFGLGATMPDATTCSKGTGLFSAFNAGDFDFAFSNKAGTKLGFLLARGAALLGLSDNSTLAGSWLAQGLSRLGVTASYKNNTLTNSGSIQKIVQIDATRQFILFGGTTVYGIVYDSSQANPWGSVLTIRTGAANDQCNAVLSAAAQILVISCDATTGIVAVTITLTGGTGATLNSGTKATAALASNNSTLSVDLVAVGTGFAFGYSRTGSIIGVRGISISGTTPTIGAEQSLTPASGVAPFLFVSGSTLRAVAISATALACKPFTISGAVLTPGTEASVVTSANIFRCFMNGNGNIVAQYLNTTPQVTIFKLTGTVEAASTVQLSNSVVWTAIASTDYAAISASKTCFLIATTTSYSVNILTDTAGTASVGAEYTFAAGSIASVCAAPVSGNTARFVVSATNSDGFQVQIDCSGASPSLSGMYNYGTITSGTYNYPQATDSRGRRANATVYSNGSVCSVSSSLPSYVMTAGGSSFSNPPISVSTNNAIADPINAAAIWVCPVTANTSFYKIEVVL